MHARFTRLLIGIKSSFWLIPGLLAVFALAAASALVNFDQTYTSTAVMRWLALPETGTEGARLVVSTVAGSMITVASLVFSLTLIALTLMSQQLGPRILPIFMTDKTTQVVLGFFIATFLFSLIVLTTIGTGPTKSFVPQVSLYAVCTLAIVAFGLMIFFIHHIARSIQADAVIAMLSASLNEQIDEVLIDHDGEEEPSADQPDWDSACALEVKAPRSGYIQQIEYREALALASQHDMQLRYLHCPGHYVLAGTPVIEATHSDEDGEITEMLAATMSFGRKRTPAQQVEYEFNTVLEIALRALSPGVNDPLTAMACIDHMSDALSRIAKGPLKPFHLCDRQGTARVFRYPQSFEHYLRQVLHPLRQVAQQVPQVARHLAAALASLNHVCENRDDAREALARHANLLIADFSEAIANESDREETVALLEDVAAGSGR